MANPSHDLLPCPFCGSAEVSRDAWESLTAEGPGCDECGATAATDADWNRRATPPSPSTAPEVKTWQERCGDTGMMPSLQEASLAMKAEIADLRAALASRPAEVDDEGLPAPAAWAVGEELFTCHDAIPFRLLPPIGQPEPLFTAEQYRQGQRDAVAADRARRGAVEKPQVVQDWRALGYVVGATVRQEIGLGRYDDAVITHAERNGALDVEMNGRAYGWSAQFCKVVAAPTEKKAAS